MGGGEGTVRRGGARAVRGDGEEHEWRARGTPTQEPGRRRSGNRRRRRMGGVWGGDEPVWWVRVTVPCH